MMAIFIILICAVGAFFAVPLLAYLWSYMAARGRWDGIRDSKMKSSIKNLLNLKKYVKES